MVASALEGKLNTDLLRLKKESVQQQALIENLKGELAEKEKKFIKMTTELKFVQDKLRAGSSQFENFESIVQKRVTDALGEKERELEKLRQQKEIYEERIKTLQRNLEQQHLQNENLLAKNIQLENTVLMNTNYGTTDQGIILAKVREDCIQKEKRIEQLLHDYNTISNQMAEYLQENAYLRQLSNVPANFGLKRENVKLHDMKTADDLKKLVKVLQDDNFHLEEERAKLKHALRVLSIQDLNGIDDRNPDTEKYRKMLFERINRMKYDELQKIDGFIVRLLNGNDGNDADRIARLNAELASLRNNQNDQLDLNKLKDAFKGQHGGNDELLQQLIDQNEMLKERIEQLLAKVGTGQQTYGSNDPLAMYYGKSDFLPPSVNPTIPGSDFHGGFSRKFNNSLLGVHNENGQEGQKHLEVAFLQLQLQELLEINKRKDQNIKEQSQNIDDLHRRIKKHLLTQDHLYKDYIKLKKNFEKRLNDKEEQIKLKNDEVRKLGDTNRTLQHSLDGLNAGNSDLVRQRYIQLTKDHCQLQEECVVLTRKFTNLDEQEKLLRRQYHDKDEQMGEKDIFIQQRFNDLKRWKESAIQQLNTLFQKLKNAVPQSEYQILNDQYQLKLSQFEEQAKINAKHTSDLVRIRGYQRQQKEMKQKQQEWDDQQFDLVSTIEILTKRLEALDPQFRVENQIFNEIALRIVEAKISLKKAFEIFDSNGDGSMSFAEFRVALQKCGISNLSGEQLRQMWDSLDFDHSDNVSVQEFCKKLEFYGVRNLSNTDVILSMIVQAAKEAGIKQWNDLFDVIDKTGSGTIDRRSFQDLFINLGVKVRQEDLDRFCDLWWSDKKSGIDYQAFLRMTKKFKLQDHEKKQQRLKIFSEKALRMMKTAFDAIQNERLKRNVKIADLFRKVDGDGTMKIDKRELYEMFSAMGLTKIGINEHISAEIFDMMDVDQSGSVSIAEFTAQFNQIISKNLEVLVGELKAESAMEKLANQRDKRSASEIQMQDLKTRNDIKEAKIKQLEKKVRDLMNICKAAEEQFQIQLQNNNELEANWDQKNKEINECKQKVIQMEIAMKGMIPKDDSENLMRQNEMMKTELVEVRSAMLSYKNMTQVFADQAKNIKLMHERKKDEHESTLQAMREMQAESSDKQRLGKLYSIIMLSRWQEAATNKKYDQMLSENKTLRQHLLEAEVKFKDIEAQKSSTQNEVLQKQDALRELQQQLNRDNQQYMVKSSVDYFNKLIDQLGEHNLELEEKIFAVNEQFEKDKDLLDEALTKIHTFELFNLQDIQKANPQEMYTRMIELANTYKDVALKEKQATRKMVDMQARIEYLQNLFKGKTQTIQELEQQNANVQSEMIKLKEDFIKRENERATKYFSGLTGYVRPATTNQPFGNTIRKNFDPNGGNAGSDSNDNRPRAGDDYTGENGELILAKEQIEKMQRRIQIQDAQIEQLKKWQGIDNVFDKDEMMKDIIENQNARIVVSHDKEQKEMSDAAYQTIKTLQDMLSFKTKTIQEKDLQLEALREEMIERRKKDAEQIVKLQSENYKLQKEYNELQHKSVGISNTKPNRPDKYENKTERYYEQLIRDKDKVIEDMQRKLQGKNFENNSHGTANKDQQRQIDELKNENKSLNSRLKAQEGDKKRFTDLQKKRDEQDKNIKTLQDGLDKLKEQLNKEIAKNLSTTGEGKNQIEDLISRKHQQEIQTLNAKNNDLIASKREIEKENQNLKVERNRQDTKIQDLLKEKESQQKDIRDNERKLQEFRIDNERQRKQLVDYQNKDQGANSLEAFKELQKKMQELEQENRTLQKTQKTVVAYDKEREIFTWIGEPKFLELNQKDLRIDDILEEIFKHINSAKNLSSLRAVCQSFDIYRTGELSRQEFKEAVRLIGIELTTEELNTIEKKCAAENAPSGYINYDPIVRHLQEIPTFYFMRQNPLVKIADHVIRSDASQSNLRSWFVDPKNQNVQSLSYQEFMSKLRQLCSNPDDLSLNQNELDEIWKFFNKGSSNTEAQRPVNIDRIVDEIYQVVRARVINDVYQKMQRHEQYFWQLLYSHNKSKEEFLTSMQFKGLMIDIGCGNIRDNVYDDLTKEVIKARNGKLTYALLMKFFGNAFVTVRKQPDFQPSQDKNQGNPTMLTKLRQERVQKIARKLLISWPKCKTELNNEEGIMSNNDLQSRLESKSNLDTQELQDIVRWADQWNRGQICISIFIQRLLDLAQESSSDILLRELYKKSNLQGINLFDVLTKFDRNKTKNLDKRSFKSAISSLPLGYSDAEIDKLFDKNKKEVLEGQKRDDRIIIKDFTDKIKEVGKSDVLPQDLRKNENPGTFGSKQNSFAEPPHELEKKYAKTLSELKDQIETQNKDLIHKKKELERKEDELYKLQKENDMLNNRLCAKPDASSNVEHLRSELQAARDEAQKLSSENTHISEVNLTLRKKLNVDLKAELGKLTTEKEQSDQKLRVALDRLKQKTDEFNMLIGKPMDEIVKREEREHQRQRAIDIMDQDINRLEQVNQELQEKLFKAEERILDLKFEKETFDLQYSRMQKRISELEKYKMKAAVMSNDVRKKHEDELEEIREQTDKMRGDSLSFKSQGDVKLRRKTSKTAQELEQMVENLKRVVEKQKVELEMVNQQKNGLESQVEKKVNEPAMLNKIKTLETQLQHYSMQELSMEKQDQTIKKLKYANDVLRTDLEREIERFNQLENKFRELLIKYNIKSKENARNQQTLFETATGAQFHNFESFIDEQGEFKKRDGFESDVSLNDLNRSASPKKLR